MLPGSTFARLFRTEEGRALFGGVAAHAFRPLHYPMTSAVGMGIIAAGHRHGWAVAEGGSQSITDAMVTLLGELGGKIETGVRVDFIAAAVGGRHDVRSGAERGRRDPRRPVAPPNFARIHQVPARSRCVQSRLRRRGWRAVDESGRPSGRHRSPGRDLRRTRRNRAGDPRRADARAAVVLVGQQYLADPQRSVGDVHPVWSYAHVPNGYTGDATEAIVAQIERFAPGFRDRIVGRLSGPPPQMSSYNLNYVGGDIMTGAKDIRQLTFGPRITLSPYTIGVPGMYICSAATPPGPGAHGMCGADAAELSLSHPSPQEHPFRLWVGAGSGQKGYRRRRRWKRRWCSNIGPGCGEEGCGGAWGHLRAMPPWIRLPGVLSPQQQRPRSATSTCRTKNGGQPSHHDARRCSEESTCCSTSRRHRRR